MKNKKKFGLAFFGLLFILLLQAFFVMEYFRISVLDPLDYIPDWAQDLSEKDRLFIGEHYKKEDLRNVLFFNLINLMILAGFIVVLFVSKTKEEINEFTIHMDKPRESITFDNN